jgi:hypothetical protein
MVDRRRLQRLEERVQKHGLVVQLRNGETKIFSEHAPFYLWAYELETMIEVEEGREPSEPTTPHGREALALREALENATSESLAAYERKTREWMELGAVLKHSHEDIYGEKKTRKVPANEE